MGATPKWKRVCFLATGLVCGAFLALALGELYLRAFPPLDLHPYRGDRSPISGPFKSNPEFGVSYRSWETFCADNPLTASRGLHLLGLNPPALIQQTGTEARPTAKSWLVLGNSACCFCTASKPPWMPTLRVLK